MPHTPVRCLHPDVRWGLDFVYLGTRRRRRARAVLRAGALGIELARELSVGHGRIRAFGRRMELAEQGTEDGHAGRHDGDGDLGVAPDEEVDVVV